jgi:hypothetical protein
MYCSISGELCFLRSALPTATRQHPLLQHGIAWKRAHNLALRCAGRTHASTYPVLHTSSNACIHSCGFLLSLRELVTSWSSSKRLRHKYRHNNFSFSLYLLRDSGYVLCLTCFNVGDKPPARAGRSQSIRHGPSDTSFGDAGRLHGLGGSARCRIPL